MGFFGLGLTLVVRHSVAVYVIFVTPGSAVSDLQKHIQNVPILQRSIVKLIVNTTH